MANSSPNPYSGCLIMGLIATFVVGGISWTIYTGWKQSKAITAFTTEAPAVWEDLVVDETKKAALAAKLAPFATALRAQTAAELRLSIEEINLLLATEPSVGDYKTMVRATGFDVTKQTILCDLSMPMNSFPGQAQRYLVGTAEAKFSRAEAQLWLTLVAISVPGKEVDQGFLTNLSTWNWLSALPDAEKAMVQHITEAKVEAEILLLRSGPLPAAAP